MPVSLVLDDPFHAPDAHLSAAPTGAALFAPKYGRIPACPTDGPCACIGESPRSRVPFLRQPDTPARFPRTSVCSTSPSPARRNCRALPRCVTWCGTFTTTIRFRRAIPDKVSENVPSVPVGPVGRPRRSRRSISIPRIEQAIRVGVHGDVVQALRVCHPPASYQGARCNNPTATNKRASTVIDV